MARALGARRRDAVFFAAVASTVLLVAVSVREVVQRWRDQRVNVHRALDRELMDAGALIADHLGSLTATAEQVLLAPVHGFATGAGGRGGIDLDAFERYAAEHLAGLGVAGDPGHGVFRIDLDAPWPSPASLDARGRARDPDVARAILERVGRHGERPAADSGRLVRASVRDGARPLRLVYARSRGRDGRPAAVVGVTYDGAHWDARLARQMVETVPLLPPSFGGVDWETADWAAHDARGRPIRAVVGKTSVRHNRQLAVTLADAAGRTLYSTPGAERAAGSPHATRLIDKERRVYVALPGAHGRRLVAAAVPLGPEQWTVAGVALLGALFVAGALLEMRRQHQLAEARRNFVAAVSHELRTPLAHMALLSETLLGPAAQSRAQQRRWLGVIHRESIRLGRLLENVLLHARGEQHDLAVVRRPTDAAALAREVAATMEPAAAARGARVRVAAPARCPLDADPGAIRHVLVNLLDNAIKYGPDRQTVTLTVARRGDLVAVAVDDEGPGIPAADRARVWRPFVRLGDRGGATGGSGLGLSVVRELVRLHGGAAHIARSAAGGARVTVTLPAGAADDAPPDALPDDGPDDGPNAEPDRTAAGA